MGHYTYYICSPLTLSGGDAVVFLYGFLVVASHLLEENEDKLDRHIGKFTRFGVEEGELRKVKHSVLDNINLLPNKSPDLILAGPYILKVSALGKSIEIFLDPYTFFIAVEEGMKKEEHSFTPTRALREILGILDLAYKNRAEVRVELKIEGGIEDGSAQYFLYAIAPAVRNGELKLLEILDDGEVYSYIVEDGKLYTADIQLVKREEYSPIGVEEPARIV